MEVEMYLLIALVVLGSLNLLMLFAIAVSLGKLLKYLGEEGEGVPLSRESGNQIGPNYVDQTVLDGQGEPHSDGVTQRPTARNWDGVSPQ